METPRAAGFAGLAFGVLFVSSIVLLRDHPPTGSTSAEIRNFYLGDHAGRVALVGVYALALLDRGSHCRAYLLKDRVRNRAELMAAVRAVAAGGSLIDAKIVEPLALARSRAEQSPLKELTPREHQVLAEIAQGKNNLAIAQSLRISKHAVDRYVQVIFIKLNLAGVETVDKRVKAVLMFLNRARRHRRNRPPDARHGAEASVAEPPPLRLALRGSAAVELGTGLALLAVPSVVLDV